MAEFVRHTYFADMRPGQRVLEIGAGLGTNLLAIKDLAHVTAVEPSAFARGVCEKQGIPAFARPEDLPPGSRYDIVLLRHVIEHVPEPRALLLQAKALLAPGGKLIVAVPIEPIKAAPSLNDLDHHLYSWTRQTLHNFLSDCGFARVETRLNYRNGRRLLLPVYRMFGGAAYTRALALFGRVRGLCEIVAEAR
jgi:2-polyprenyl-3-methyl-5-hydroxy-6-metoxy-1,4-benzoquinol methylase